MLCVYVTGMKEGKCAARPNDDAQIAQEPIRSWCSLQGAALGPKSRRRIAQASPGPPGACKRARDGRRKLSNGRRETETFQFKPSNSKMALGRVAVAIQPANHRRPHLNIKDARPRLKISRKDSKHKRDGRRRNGRCRPWVLIGWIVWRRRRRRRRRWRNVQQQKLD